MAVTSNLKKKRVSKKNKSSWRKFIDIKDVDDFLEDQRLEERLGFEVSKLSDDQLFQVDVVPSEEKATNLTSKQKKRQQIRETLPKCLSLLQPHTKVPDPITKRNRVRTKEERRNLLVKIKEQKDKLNGIVKAKDLQAHRDRLKDDEKRKNKPKKYEFKADLWDNGENAQIENDPWINTVTKRHTLKNQGKASKRITRSEYKEKSVLPSIEIPHPGTSYNPSLADHQDLLNAVAKIEKDIMKEEEHLNRVTKDMKKKFSAAKKDSSWILEMSEGLPKPGEQIPETDSDTDSEYKSINPPVKNKKKTPQQRRKHQEHLQRLKALQTAKLEKKKIADLYKLRFLQKQIENLEQKTKILQEKRKRAETRKLKEAKRLGPVKYEEPDLAFTVGGELTGNLRSLKKHCNLLEERFKSLQKRNVLEPRVRQKRPKVKTKRFVRSGHKDDWKTTVAK